MKFFQIWIVYLICAFFVITTEERCRDDTICTETKVHGMWTADCYKGEFKNFPQCIRKDVEVIDLSYNRLRKITRDNLQRYTSLKMLYLSDNILTNLEDSVFQDMTNLISLDLSLNPIAKLPTGIFQLPSLKRLYLSQNQNMNIIEVVDEAKTITSPLEAIHLGFNELETLPNFGSMPHLILYNISGNNLLNMKPGDFAGMCNLKNLINHNFTTNFNEPCDCWNVQRWLKERGVKFSKILCEVKENECLHEISIEDKKLYDECKVQYEDYELKSSLIKIGVPVIVGVLVLILIIIIYCVYKRKKRLRKSKLKQNLAIRCSVNGEKDGVGLI